MAESDALLKYHQLLSKVDEKFREIRQRYPDQFKCKGGCFRCCAPDFTISLVEKENIKRFFLEHPEVREAAEKLLADDPHHGRQCKFLGFDGHCVIYEVRPVICRSHGAPIICKPDEDSDDTVTDVCPLNFVGFELEHISETDFINLETLNTILAFINFDFDKKKSLTRTPLDVSKII